MKHNSNIHFKSNPETVLVRRQENSIGNRHIDTNSNDRIKSGIMVKPYVIRVRRSKS